MKSFRDLRVWHAAMDLVEKIYLLTREFPKEELYGLTSQLRRAGVSVPSNIAEGHTREHLKEYLHHISIAQSSLAEVETQLEIALRLGYVTRKSWTCLRGLKFVGPSTLCSPQCINETNKSLS